MKGYRFLSAIAGLALFLSLLLTSIDLLCFNRSFFRFQYSINHTAESIGISEDGLMNATNALLDYMQDKRDDIKVIEKVNGSEREVFDERETLHMVDVKNLYLNAMTTRTILFVGSIMLLTFLVLTHRNESYMILANAYRNGLLFLGSLLLFVGIYAIFTRSKCFNYDQYVSIKFFLCSCFWNYSIVYKYDSFIKDLTSVVETQN